MTAVGVIVPRVVVRPPNLPAPPPISLLTQGNVVDDMHDWVQQSPGDNPARWEGGGGTVWWEPLRQGLSDQTWQSWPDAGGDPADNKRDALSGGVTVPKGPDASFVSPIQRPIVSALEISQDVLAAYVLEHSIEGDVHAQMTAALDAVMPRVVTRELWDAGEALRAHWADQFRLKGAGVVVSDVSGAFGFLRALALAEQAAADHNFIDNFGGAYIHVSPALFSLLASVSHGLVRSPTGRQVQTMTGCMLVPSPGATGTWSDAHVASFVEAKPAGSQAGDNVTNGWMFVTPPVRVRLGEVRTYDGAFEFTNDETIVGERAFVLEASVDETSVAIPVDYTKEV